MSRKNSDTRLSCSASIEINLARGQFSSRKTRTPYLIEEEEVDSLLGDEQLLG